MYTVFEAVGAIMYAMEWTNDDGQPRDQEVGQTPAAGAGTVTPPQAWIGPVELGHALTSLSKTSYVNGYELWVSDPPTYGPICGPICGPMLLPRDWFFTHGLNSELSLTSSWGWCRFGGGDKASQPTRHGASWPRPCRTRQVNLC